ncbi:MAG: histidinol dehydrogenase, partial [Bacteroidetes bacterium]|nr:histidinol dehydrogenase [Bacteroidota bacterium]
MKTIKYPLRKEWDELLKRPVFESTSLEGIVKDVLTDVKKNGDVALKKYTKQFDSVELEEFLVTDKEFVEAEKKVSNELKLAIQQAKTNIEKFHSLQKEDIKFI